MVVSVPYKGRGEAGIAPTPGGQAASGPSQGDPVTVYHQGSDGVTSAQATSQGATVRRGTIRLSMHAKSTSIAGQATFKYGSATAIF
ncbi:hypothetical protein CJO79_19615 (plasmid) [Ralstonia solanacearum]|nr:hypothetical protein CJO76_19630 [Ralstonia solanacearum]AXV93199.1 hypothetical protein CJO79_19615 [Ralstonia solanacearum]AXW21247.1 hypothetical protein CJO85_19690 [Ralstonia solanacearum]AXW78094.1 hypothetical protein CJO97_19610 [Ralstonia solanacearum]BEU74301.1 hypothetical protein MAFF211271_38560 [Ralstonia pseudosolanacearum]